MPPWIIPELAPEAPEATSFFSNIKVLRPRIAASRAIPVPFTPPPITITSNSAGAVIFCCSLQQGVEKLLRSPPALLRSPWRAHVLPRTLRAPGPTAPRIWACSRRFSTPCRVFSLFAFECLLPPGEQVQRFQRGERFNAGAAQLGEELLLGAGEGRPLLADEKSELLRRGSLGAMGN